MHNWRLLLLAFLAAFQPIASLTERSLVNGRQECSQHHSRRETRLSIYGTFQNGKPVEERRLNHPESRENRRHELLSGTTASERRVDFRDREERLSPERIARFDRIQYREIAQFDRRDSRVSDRDQRSRQVSQERLPRNSRVIRHNERQQPEREFPSLFERRNDEHVGQRSRFSVDARRDSRRNGDFVRGSRRITESRIELQRERNEVARMEPARHREETRISMERTRQMDREVSPRRDARLQQREWSLGRLTRDESQRRSSPLNTRNYNRARSMEVFSRNSRIDMIGDETRRFVLRNQFTVNNRDINRDARDLRDERNFVQREHRARTKRSLIRNSESRSERSTEQNIAQTRRFQTKTSEVHRSRVMERRSNENIRSSNSERRLTDATAEVRRSRVARASSLTDRRSNDYHFNTEQRQSTNLEMRSTEQFRDFSRSRNLGAMPLETDRRSTGRSSKLHRSRDLESRATERSGELRQSRDTARSRSLEIRSARTEQAAEDRREFRQSLRNRKPMEQREIRQSIDRESRVQTRQERRSDNSRNNELESRKITNFGSVRSIHLESRRSDRDIRTPDRRERRTVSETRRAESRRVTDRESIRAREIERRDFRIESSRRSMEQISTRLQMQARDIRNLALERDIVVSRTRAEVTDKRTRNVWSFAHEKPQVDAKSFLIDWRYLLYTVQGIYLASFLVKLMGEKGAAEKKIR